MIEISGAYVVSLMIAGIGSFLFRRMVNDFKELTIKAARNQERISIVETKIDDSAALVTSRLDSICASINELKSGQREVVSMLMKGR